MSGASRGLTLPHRLLRTVVDERTLRDVAQLGACYFGCVPVWYIQS